MLFGHFLFMKAYKKMELCPKDKIVFPYFQFLIGRYIMNVSWKFGIEIRKNIENIDSNLKPKFSENIHVISNTENKGKIFFYLFLIFRYMSPS